MDRTHGHVNAKDGAGIRSSYDSKSRTISSLLTKLESEREEISDSEREANAPASQIERKEAIDLSIDDLRNSRPH